MHKSLNRERGNAVTVLFLICLLMLPFLIQLVNKYKEYNRYQLASALAFSEAEGKEVRLDRFRVLSEGKPLEAGVEFKDTTAVVLIESLAESPKASYAGRIQMLEEGRMLLVDSEASATTVYRGIYYTENMRSMLFLIGLIMAGATIYFIVKFKYFFPPASPVVAKGSPIEQWKLYDILQHEPTIDNVWVCGGYMLINDSNNITSVRLDDVVWISTETLKGKYGTKYYMVQLATRRKKTYRQVFETESTSVLLAMVLRRAAPHAAFGQSKELSRLYRRDVNRFIDEYVGPVEYVPDESWLNDAAFQRQIRSLRGAKQGEEKTSLVSLIVFLLVFFEIIAFLALTLLVCQYLQKGIVFLMLDSKPHSPLLTLQALFYSSLALVLAVTIMVALHVYCLTRWVKRRWKGFARSSMEYSLLIILVFPGLFSVFLPFPMALQEVGLRDMARLFTDIRQIKSGQLLSKEIFVTGEQERIEDRSFLIPSNGWNWADYEVYVLTGVDYPSRGGDRDAFVGYNICPAGTFESGYSAEGSAEENNQSPRYRIRYTENFRMLIDLQKVEQ